MAQGTLAVEYRSLASLRFDPQNPRLHERKQIRQIARSIEAFGFNVPVLIDARGQLIAGHGRVLAAQLLGMTHVPTIMLEHLNEAQIRAFNIADNRLTENSVSCGKDDPADVGGDSGNSSKLSNGRSRKVRQLDHQPRTNTEILAGALAGRATGPRTEAGKRRSSQNATKYGIFSKAALITGESPKDHETLLRGLRRDWQPEGTLENTLVDRLAMLVLRLSRLLKAEAGEVNKVRDFLVEDDYIRQLSDAQRHEKYTAYFDEGILHTCSNPIVFNKAIEMLTDVLSSFSSHGFDAKGHFATLHKLYGDFSAESPPEGFLREFVASGMLASGEPEELERRGLKPEELKASAIASLESEIKRLRNLKQLIKAVESKRRPYMAQSMLVPNREVLDGLQRCEAHLSREFDRTLGQLERCQRMRLGQPVPPEIQVKFSR